METYATQQPPKTNWWFIFFGWTLGLAIGMGGTTAYMYPLYRDAVNTAATFNEQLKETRSSLEQTAANMQGLTAMLTQANTTISQQFGQSTIIYETPATTQLATGLRGILGLATSQIPGANVVPRWIISAKVKPMFVGNSNGAVYYYVGSDAKADGPYLPEAAK